MKEANPEEQRRGGHIQRKKSDKELGGAGRGRRAPPSLSLWLNADLFKRIVHRLANLPAASAAERDGANVMRVVALPAYVPAASGTGKLLNEGFTPLCTHWPLSGHLFQGNQRFTHRKIERPKTPISK